MTSRPAEVRAPGKLVLAGEYAVLEGAPGVVMAVDRYVRVRPGGAGARDLVGAARAAAARRFGIAVDPLGFQADSDALETGGVKLGLGSSAAVAVAAAASVLAGAGRDVEDAAVRRQLWPVVRAVHDAHQGERGSGIDVAASLFGGFVVLRPGTGGVPDLAPWQPPAGLDLRVAWTGAAASTPGLVRAVRAWGARDPAGHADAIAALGQVAVAIAAAGPGDAPVVIEGFRQHARVLAALGRAAAVDLVPDAVATLGRTAADLGGAAKPSGAGGGDCVVAAFPDRASGERFAAAATGLGARVLDLRAAPRGVHACGPGEGG